MEADVPALDPDDDELDDSEDELPDLDDLADVEPIEVTPHTEEDRDLE
jgi:hypothetical protein